MKSHTLLYLKSFGYDISDFLPCEVCGAKAVDIHHIEARGMGGTKQPNRIESLQALCRKHHHNYGDMKEFKSWLYKVHIIHMEQNGVKFDRQWIDGEIVKSENFSNFASRDQIGSDSGTSEL